MRNTKMEEHLHDAAVENVRFLMDNGEPFDHACKRVGYSTSAMEKAFDRRGLPYPNRKEMAQ